jgi:hypothetical protein
MSGDLASRLAEVRARIARAAVRCGRDPGSVALVAVTKTVPTERIREAYEAGLRDFGENRVQEALSKMGALPADTRWHLIGRLQTNKINKVLDRFALVQSVDSVGLADGLSKRLAGRVQKVLLEVNTSGEDSKAGVEPREATEAVRAIRAKPGLALRGLMTVGPLTGDADRRREAFRRLREIFEAVRKADGTGSGFDVLSMGMSADFEEAVEEGSTLVRVGTALFGERG